MILSLPLFRSKLWYHLWLLIFFYTQLSRTLDMFKIARIWSLLTIFSAMTQVWVTITSHLDMQASFLPHYFSFSSVMVYFPHSNHIIPFKCTSGQSMALNNGPPIIPLLGGSLVKKLPVKRRDNRWGYHCWVRKIPGEGNGSCSSILAWKILWTEEPGGLQSIGSQRIRLDWATEHACTLTSLNIHSSTDHLCVVSNLL